MIKKSLTILFVLILSFQLISAVEINVLAENKTLSSGETLIAKVSANFIQPITKENVFFYQGSVLDSNFQISLDYDVIKIGDEFYIYAILLNKPEGNYTVTVENARYMKGASISEETIVGEFSIDSQTADFYVKPGVISTSGDFFVEVQNLNENTITVSVDTETNISEARQIFVGGSKTASVSLKSGEIKKIYFTLGTGESGLRYIGLKTDNLIYEIPVYIPLSLEGGATSDASSFSFEPSELNISLPINSVTKKIVYLYNSGNKNFTNVSLYFSNSISPFVTLSKTSIESLNADSYTFVELSFSSAAEANVDGELNAKIGDTIISSSVYLQFLSNYTSTNESQYSSAKTCAELNGKTFNRGTEKCDKDPIYAKDNVCCLGAVQKIKSSSTGTIIAVILIVVVIGGLIWFYFAKYRKTKKPINFLKAAQPKKF
ncbi:MAG: hypothetical protein PHQ66_03440 [Candidatus Nanoarchaeia archaeon]|nr:hypothetical protein [Candidatus Nanoarchaeia archaeon]MDD5357584.1 hypothetical protein [Candidatus Nanoarchaeia archaeon]MDD5588503.1 hypothetical protein [Candidatus Nanoarchaeia archaeon]